MNLTSPARQTPTWRMYNSLPQDYQFLLLSPHLFGSIAILRASFRVGEIGIIQASQLVNIVFRSMESVINADVVQRRFVTTGLAREA